MKHSPYALYHISPSVENTHFSKIKNAGNLNPVVTTYMHPAMSFRNENKENLYSLKTCILFIEFINTYMNIWRPAKTGACR